LQWKCYTPFMMIIDNWSKHEKKPFSYGEPYTTHNRKALKLKSRLMPYLYSYSYECHQTGVPVQRALVFEFPNDSNTWLEVGDNAKTKYQFMAGESFLVAPVYEDTDTWSVYLPEGKWTDYENGKTYQGGQTISNYDVSDFKLPVLVREGAIIPMYPEAHYENRKQVRPRDPLQVDIYPHATEATSFTMFEDDGLTYKFRENKFNKTLFACDAATNGDVIQISVNGCAQGEGYEGMPQERNYYFTVHGNQKPQSVTWTSDSDITNPLDEVNSTTALEGSDEGWCYLESNEGVLHIKLKPQNYKAGLKIKIEK